MPTNYFQCKQFLILQDKCAMKVSEDACVFAAYLKIKSQTVSLLDVGFGTGLLSLMLAQRYSEIDISAIEIDENSFKEGLENIKKSKFSERIKCFHQNYFQLDDKKKFDAIVCNPPFYENYLVRKNEYENIARHTTEFTLQQLLEKAKTLLSTQGELFLLLPSKREEELKKIALQTNFFIPLLTFIHYTIHHTTKRMIVKLSLQKELTVKEKIILKKENHSYSSQTIEILKDFYLKL